jgi:hypothetical protein
VGHGGAVVCFGLTLKNTGIPFSLLFSFFFERETRKKKKEKEKQTQKERKKKEKRKKCRGARCVRRARRS